MIAPVIAGIAHQMTQINRLVDYCYQLDGTKLKVVPVNQTGFSAQYPENEFGCRQAHGLLSVARAMKGKPFLWIEPDSIPLRAGWVKALNDEYQRLGKKFLLSCDSNPPFDLIGGIGIYPAETAWLIPEGFRQGSWDGWLINNVPHLIARTPLIQHTYGKYPGNGTVLPHIFPRDFGLVRRDAVIFHKDKFQGLIPKTNMENVFLHSGDLGDIISFLPVIRQLRGGRLIVSNYCDGQRETMKGARFEAIKPLLEKQSYLSAVEYSEAPVGVTHDSTGFRRLYPRGSRLSLTQVHGLHFGVEHIDLSPWLKVDPSPKGKGRVIIARAARYQNQAFPWKAVADRFGDAMLFVGFSDEHKAFEEHCGCKVDYEPTLDLLELAGIIASAQAFVASQSCPFWIGAGLGVNLVQETCAWEPSAIIPRSNARYVLSDTDAFHYRASLSMR